LAAASRNPFIIGDEDKKDGIEYASFSSAFTKPSSISVQTTPLSARPNTISQGHQHSNSVVSDPHTVTLTPAQAFAFRDVVSDAAPFLLSP
jgi:hypothetical protein